MEDHFPVVSSVWGVYPFKWGSLYFVRQLAVWSNKVYRCIFVYIYTRVIKAKRPVYHLNSNHYIGKKYSSKILVLTPDLLAYSDLFVDINAHDTTVYSHTPQILDD